MIDGYAYLFLTDQELGVSVWRYDTPVAAIGEAGAHVWTWLRIGVLIALAALGADGRSCTDAAVRVRPRSVRPSRGSGGAQPRAAARLSRVARARLRGPGRTSRPPLIGANLSCD